jgi:anti-anti-sigma factor
MSDLAEVRIEQVDGIVTAHIEGEIDISNAVDVEEALTTAMSPGAAGMVLDLSALSYMDSAAVLVVFQLAERLTNRRQRLALAVPADAPVMRLLEIVELGDRVPVAETVAAARDVIRDG